MSTGCWHVICPRTFWQSSGWSCGCLVTTSIQANGIKWVIVLQTTREKTHNESNESITKIHMEQLTLISPKIIEASAW